MAAYTLAKILADPETLMNVTGENIISPPSCSGKRISRVDGLKDRGPVKVTFYDGSNVVLPATTVFSFMTTDFF